MNTNLLNLFAEHLEKQEVLSKLTEAEKLHGYGYSEIHTIAMIGYLESPNVTEIASKLKLTRGAVSKITKRLVFSGLIESYMIEGNQQKIFFRLTSQGKELYDEHENRHALWMQRDDSFFRKYSQKQLSEIETFMNEFNQYLDEKIKEIGGQDNDN